MKRLNYRLVARLTGMLMLIMAASVVLPIAVSLHYGDGAQYGLAIAGVVMAAVGLLLRNIVGRNASYELHARESFWITSIVWLAVPLCGALPYLFTGVLDRFTDAAFESVSGFTTTGSSVILNPAAIPQGILLWRAITQWIGGLGLILFVIAILKRLNRGSMQLYAAEFSGTQQRKLHPHIAKSVSRMWRIYSFLTLLLVVLLVLAGNGILDSLCLALSTVSTGGFMTTQFGMSGYSNATLAILTLFMFLSGINVALLYNFFTFKWRQFKTNHEFYLYTLLFILAALSCFVAFSIANGGFSFSNLQFSLFHIASTVSTCGFYTTPPAVWPFWASVVTFMLILSGASAGSTGGGIKVSRLVVLLKICILEVKRVLHPRMVASIVMSGRPVAQNTIIGVTRYLFTYVLLMGILTALYSLTGTDMIEALSTIVVFLNNVGPAYTVLGETSHFQYLGNFGYIVLYFTMIIGRIEIVSFVILLHPDFWKQHKGW